MKDKFSRHWYSHKFKYTSTICMVLLIGFGSLINMQLIKGHLDKNFARTFETFSYDGLETYHQGNVSLIRNLYTINLEKIHHLSIQSEIISSLNNAKFDSAQEFIDNLRSNPNYFNTISILDTNGVIRATSSDFPGISTYIGSDISKLDPISKLIASGSTYVGNVLNGSNGRRVIVFGAPVKNTSSTVIGYTVGNLTLESIAESLSIDDQNGYYFSVADSTGELIVNKSHSPSESLNIASKERMLERLKLNTKASDQEVNYLGDEVFVISEKVTPNNSNTSINVLSFFDKSSYDSKLSTIKDQSNSFYYNTLGIFNMFWVIASVAIILYVKKWHDKNN